MKFNIKIANRIIQLKPIYNETSNYFADFITIDKPLTNDYLSITDTLVYKIKNVRNSSSEYFNLVFPVSDYLLQTGSVIFHGVAIKIGDDVFIITAPSGTGKTTQYLNLSNLYGSKIQIINGDKPCLESCDNKIIVHPSPWRGKEGFGANLTGELKGIVILKQRTINTIRRLKDNEAALPILSQFLYSVESTEQIDTVCKIANSMIRNCPVWLLENKGDYKSSELLYKTITTCGGIHE